MKSCLAVVLLLCTSLGCSPSSFAVGQTPTPSAIRATVTDPSVPFATSEADALIPRGFLGSAQLGRLDMGCTVEVVKTTDRAAQVKVVGCPQMTDKNPPVGTPGWVAKSALNLKP